MDEQSSLFVIFAIVFAFVGLIIGLVASIFIGWHAIWIGPVAGVVLLLILWGGITLLERMGVLK